jgi:Sulfotransferase family/SEC-C motif
MTSRFERPVFIMAAPRSCSTLLFQTLTQSGHLWSIGDESHHLIEQFPQLNPLLGGVDSNRLTAHLLDTHLRHSLRDAFAAQLRDRDGRRMPADEARMVRLLEKTPKNALRIPFLDALFPDALYIYLVRDPKENLSSIIDAWRSRRFVTYPTLRTAHGPWSLLLPPSWRDYVDRPLEEVAAFQWKAANHWILEDLDNIPPARRIVVNAAELLQDPPQLVAKLCAFMGIELDVRLAAYLERPLPVSYHTLSAPQENKWVRNALQLERVWSEVGEMVARINAFAGDRIQPLSGDLPPVTPSMMECASRDHAPEGISWSNGGMPGRNQDCPCGSGQRYKACHGQLR